MINRSHFILALALATAPFTMAQQPAELAQTAAVVPVDQQPTDAQLNRLFEVMRIREQMAATTKVMPQLIQQQFAEQLQQMEKDHPEMANLTPAQKEASAKVMGKFMSQAMNLYTSDEMIADMKGVYQKHLTGNDVENLVTFYNSPSGQHMLDMVPVVVEEFMPKVMSKMQAKMRPLIAEMSKELAEIAEPGAGAKPEQK